MSPQALTFLSIVLAFVGGLLMGWYGRKSWDTFDNTEAVRLAEKRGWEERDSLGWDDDIRREAFRDAALEAQAIVTRLTKKRRSIPANAIVRRLSELAHPMLVAPPVSVPHSQTVTSSLDLMGTLTTTPGAGITWKTGDGPE